MTARNYGLGHWLANGKSVTYTPPRRTVGRIWRAYRRWAFAFVVGLVAVLLLFASNVVGV